MAIPRNNQKEPAGTGATQAINTGPTQVTSAASSYAMAGTFSIDTDWMGEIIF